MFQNGDRVCYVPGGDWDEYLEVGELGTVVDYRSQSYIGVAWDMAHQGFHTCNGGCKDKHGLYVGSHDIVPADDGPDQGYEIDGAVFEKMFSL